MICLSEKIAVISNGPLDEGLMMMIVSQRLKTEGRKNVTTFSRHLGAISSWFCIHSFADLTQNEDIDLAFKDYGSVVLMYQPNAFCDKCIEIFRSKNSTTKLFVFYPNEYMLKTPKTENDIVFNKKLSMVDNIALSISKILHTSHHSKSNGLSAPLSLNLTHRKHAKRVVIEKTGSTEKKLNKLAQHLKSLGFTILSLQNKLTENNLSLLYESGYFIGSSQTSLSTLASNLYIPSLLLKKTSPPRLSQAGWLNQAIITPPFWLTKITLPFTKRALSAFKKLVVNHHELIT